MATRVTREQLDVGYTPDSEIKVTRMVTEVLQSVTVAPPAPSGGARAIVVVAAG